MPSTQSLLEFSQIREGVILLKNGALRGILMVSPTNFALKSDDEQTAIIYSFQEFLNSLDFPIQILVQSRRLNFTLYLDTLKELEVKQKNPLLKEQISSYREFVGALIEGAPPVGKWGEIMSKNFFVVVPFSKAEETSKGGDTIDLFSISLKNVGGITEQEFQRYKNALYERMEFVALGLRRCGLQSVPLNTAEIAELFWSSYHIAEAEVGAYPQFPPELTV